MSIRVINTRKVVVRRYVAIALVVLAGLFLAPRAFADDASVSGPSSVDTYVVGEGETLWSIASQVTPQGHDVSDTVARIKSMNVLDSSVLSIGQQLMIPST